MGFVNFSMGFVFRKIIVTISVILLVKTETQSCKSSVSYEHYDHKNIMFFLCATVTNIKYFFLYEIDSPTVRLKRFC